MPTYADDVYERLVKPIEARMIDTVARIVRDPEEAEDVLQEVLVVVWHKLEQILAHPNPHGYILRICITRSYDALRKKLRRRRFEIRLETVKAKLWIDDPHELLSAKEKADTLRAAISMLPPKQGQAVLLRALQGVSYNRIADILECCEATARSHYCKGRARLEKIMRDLGTTMCRKEVPDEG